MGKRIFLVVLSLVLAFSVGGLCGAGYYYYVHGFPGVSATPLETPPEPPDIAHQEDRQAISQNDPADDGFTGNDPNGEESPEALEVSEQNEGDNTPSQNAVEDNYPNTNEFITPIEGAEKTKIAYITIDDGPDPHNTPAILDILDKYDIKATFFVLGTNAQKYPELITQIHEQGHTIGNHTYNHIYQETYASDESFWDSVNKTEEILYQLIEFRPSIIREPGGRFMKNPEKQQMIRDQGYDLVYWNIDSYDSRSPIPDKDTIFANVKRQAQKEHLWPAMVLLFHESGSGHQSTVEALPMVIEYLLNEGFTLKALSEMDREVMANLPRP